MTVDIRFGTADDTAVITDFIIEAGAGIFEQLFEQLLPGVHTVDMVQLAVADEHSPLIYSNSVLAEENGEVLGAVVCYPAAEYGLPAVLSALIPRRRISPLRGVLDSRIDGTFYVNSLAVKPAARARGIARLLLDTASGLAVERGLGSLSLHVWSDNEPAMQLYRALGFETVRTIPVPPSDAFRYRGPIVLMQGPSLALPDSVVPRSA